MLTALEYPPQNSGSIAIVIPERRGSINCINSLWGLRVAVISSGGTKVNSVPPPQESGLSVK